VPIRYTQGDVVILKRGAEATGVVFGTQLHDPEWNPASLDPPPWTLNSPMEPSEIIPVTAQPRLRSAPHPEPRLDPAANIMSDGQSPNEFYGPRSARGEERVLNSFADWAPWNLGSGKRCGRNPTMG
jgi:hypothetical protein